MNKLTKEAYDNIVRNIAQVAAYRSDKPSIELIVKELEAEYKKHVKDNDDFIENIKEAYDYYIVSSEHKNYNNPKFERAFKLFVNNLKQIDSTKASETPKSLKLKWNGDSKQLYHLIKQLTILEAEEEVPFISNTLDEIADFISQHFEGINSKPDSIRSAISRSNISPKKGKRLIIEVK